MTSRSTAQVQFAMIASGGFKRLTAGRSVSHEELMAISSMEGAVADVLWMVGSRGHSVWS